MHEYILYSQIPIVREQQVLKILAGVTASQPVPVFEQTLVYAQLKLPEVAVSRKNQAAQQSHQRQGQGLSYHKLFRHVDTASDGALVPGDWQFRAEQTPEPGVPNFISRTVTQRRVDDQIMTQFKRSDLYRFKRQYTHIGHRFVQGNVIIRMTRIHIPAVDSPDDPVDAFPTPSSDLKILDPSGNWIIEATVRVEDASNGDISDKAKRQLLNFQNTMEGALDLYVPDRLALDTRVRNI